MDLWQALILGLVEGLTEYLPVSSTGHLLVAQRLLGIEASEAANAYAIVIQAGAIVAVLGLYRRRVVQMLLGLAGRDQEGRSMALAILVAFLPAAVVGLLADEAIESYLFGPWPVAVAWAVGGVLLLVIGNRVKGARGHPLEALTLRAALIIGIAQCAAMWPGVSRSLATILGGLGVGLSLAAAVEFSFLLGLLTLGAATAYKTLDSGSAMLEAYGGTEIAVGFVAAWVSAVLAVKWMVAWLNERGLAIFGWWRLLAAAVVVGLIWSGHLGAEEPPASSQAAPRVESTLIARVDERLLVTVHSLTPLPYRKRPDPANDLPAHVRSASCLRRQGQRLVMVQDDVHALALREDDGNIRPVLLPEGADGKRAFEERRGNKMLKMDLEACALLPDGRILAFGSGSHPAREQLILLSNENRVELRDGRDLYRALRAQVSFAGADLNVEGAVVVANELLLFQRSSSESGDPEPGVNAIGALALGTVLSWLDEDGPVPALLRVQPVELGRLSGVRLGFTDVTTSANGRLAVLACAEATSDPVVDGPVAGCRFGFLQERSLRMADVLDLRGHIAALKLEGIENRPGPPHEYEVVTDPDDPDAPALLGRLVVRES